TVNDGTRTYTVTPSSGTFGTDGIYVAMLPVTQQEVILIAETDSQNYGFGGKLITLEQGKFYTNLAIPMLKAYDLSAGNVSTTENAFIYQSDAAATANKVALNVCTAIISNLNIETDGNPGIACSGDVTLTLSGSSRVLISSGNPAIRAGDEGTTLNIQGSGSLSATGGSNAAGIGNGYFNSTCGDITISGGTVTATGGDSAAGIGSGNYGTCGNITISGGTVTATGGGNAAGIGSGWNDTCGAITISGGTVTATGGWCGAGIGSGGGGTCGDITISEGTVTATGEGYGAGIGSGDHGTCGDITISEGTVTATGGDYGVGIGSGWNGKFSSITITSGITSVTATMGRGSETVPIGKGKEDAGSGDVTIDGVENPSARASLTNLNWSVNGNTWTLTPITTP
nr:hypothetical protein [Bacteroidales bacterium]